MTVPAICIVCGEAAVFCAVARHWHHAEVPSNPHFPTPNLHPGGDAA